MAILLSAIRRAVPCLRAATLFTLSVAILGLSVPAQGLFDPIEAQFAAGQSGIRGGRPADPAQLRSRVVNIDFSQLDRARDRVGAEFDLNLFEDADVQGRVTTRRGQNNGETVMGRVNGGGHFALRVEGDIMVGNVHTADGRFFQIMPRQDGLHEVQEMDPAAMPTCGHDHTDQEDFDLEPDSASGIFASSTSGQTPETPADDGSIIDVMVCYTPAARDGAGGEAGILALINLAIDETNMGYENSGISPRMRLVHTHLVNANSSGNMSTDLTALREESDGSFDEIHALRDTYGADVVSLLVQNGGYCGIGYLMTSTSFSFDGYAFSVVKLSCATGYYSFGHEIGHNMGCAHDPDNSSNAVSAYAYGHRFGGPTDESYRSVMAYSPGTRVLQFSNPDVNFAGYPTGTALRNNARSINDVASIVANWRPSVVTWGLPATLTLSSDYLCIGDTLGITVEDGGESGSVSITVTSSGGDSETMTLTEGNAGVFLGDIAVTGGSVNTNNGTLQVADGDTVTATYIDPDPSGTASAQALVDCLPPSFSGLQGVTEGEGSVTLNWSTALDQSTPITYSIYRSTSPGAQNFGAPIATTQNLSHTDLTVVFGTTYYYVVRAEDALGQQEENTVEISASSLRTVDDFAISNLGTQRVGIPFGLTITALDQGGSTLTNYSGDVNLLAVIDGNAAPGALLPSQTGTFVNGSWTGTMTINQPGTNVQIRVTAADGSATRMSNVFSVNQVVFNISDVQVTEIDSGTGTAIVSVTSNDSFPGLTVDFATSSGSAQSGSDFVVSSGTIDFATTQSRMIPIQIVGDTTQESTESFNVVLSNPQGAIINDGTGVITIIDNDSAPTVNINDVSVAEGNSGITQMKFTMSLTEPTSSPVYVHFTTQNISADGSDFYSSYGDLSFAAGVTEKTITVLVKGDTLTESNETMSVILSNVSGAELGDGIGIGTILNDDGAVTPTLTIPTNQVSAAENSGTANINLSLSSPNDSDVVVTLGVSGTATAGSDYTVPSSVTIPAGDTSKTVAVTIINDQLIEDPETVTITAVSATGGVNLGGDVSATITITSDDEAVTPTLTVPTNQVTVNETDGSANITLSLSEAAQSDVQATISVTGGTATSGTDFTVPTTVTIPAGQTSKTFAVTIIDDALVESNETVNLSVVSASNADLGADVSASIIIVSDDVLPTLTIPTNEISVDETAGSANITLSLSAAAQSDVQVNFSAGGTATAGSDYIAPSSVTIAAGSTSRQVTITILDDSEIEDPETFIITAASATNAQLGGDVSATIIINSEDVPPTPVLTIPTNQVDVVETAGTVNVTLSLNVASAQIIPVTLSTSGTATAGSDFTAPTSVSIPAGATSVQAAITILNDTDVEDPETIIITATGATGADLGGDVSATITINSEDVPPLPVLTMPTNQVNVNEDAGDVPITLSLDKTSETDVVVTIGHSGSATPSADYNGPNTVTIPAGQTTKQFNIGIIDDEDVEDEETITLAVTSATGVELGGDISATIIITSEDVPPPAVLTIPTNQVEVDEADGQTMITLALSKVADTQVSVNLSTAGTATAGSDFTAPTSVNIPAGATSVQFAVSLIDDDEVEDAETVTITATSATGAMLGADVTATITINSEDLPPNPTLTIPTDEIDVDETDGSASVTLSLSEAVQSSVSVSLNTSGTATAGSDFTAPSSVVIPAGATSVQFSVTILNDSEIEDPETVTIMATSATGGVELGGDVTAIITIISEDVPPPPVVTIPTGQVEVDETAGFANITLSLDKASETDVQVTLSATGSASAGNDYVMPSVVSIAAGQTSKQVAITIVNDTDVEDPETINIEAISATNAVLGGDISATITINSEDVPPTPVLTIPTNQVSVDETAGSVSIILSLDIPSDSPTSVTLSAAGTATAGSDYNAPGNAVIPAGATSVQVAITILDDEEIEDPETITITATGATGVDLGGDVSATITINSEDVPPTPVLTVPTDRIDVDEPAGDVQVTLSLDIPAAQDVPVTLLYSGSATSGVDYSASTSATIPAGSTSAQVTIGIVDDSEIEDAETIIVTVSSAAGADLGSDVSATIVITSDDVPVVPVVSIPTGSVQVDETAGETQVTVSLDTAGDDDITVVLGTSGSALKGNDYNVATSVIIPAGTTSVQVPVTILDDDLVEDNETIIITAISATGADLGTDVTSTITIVSDDTAVGPVLTIITEDLEVDETSGKVAIRLKLSENAPETVNIVLSTTGTATNGVDFNAPTGVSIPAGRNALRLVIPIIDDEELETVEDFTLSIASATNVTLGGDVSVKVTIHSDEVLSLPTLSVTTPDFAISEEDSPAIVTLSLSEPSETDIDVTLDMPSGSATRDSDFAAPGWVTIPAGETSLRVGISILDDDEIEGQESFTLTVASATNVILGSDLSTTVTIIDNDVAPDYPTISWSADTLSLAESVGQQDVTVNLNRPHDDAVRVTVHTLRGRARDIDDFEPIAVELIFAPGVTQRTVTITLIDDTVKEHEEDFSITLSDAVNGLITNDTVLVNITDNDETNSSARRFLLRSADGMTAEELDAADVNGDGEVTINDVVYATLLDQQTGE